jgi:hypothetical protein
VSRLVICNHELATCRFCADEMERLQGLLRDAYKELYGDRLVGTRQELLDRIKQALPKAEGE